MTEEVRVLIAFFADGIIIGLLFDLFRAIRKCYKTSNIIIYIEDVLFWILAGLLTLVVIFIFANGQIRLYMVLMLILGCIIYFATISKYIMLLSTKIINIIKYIFKISTLPFIKLFQFIKKRIIFKIFLKNNGKWRILCYNVEENI